MSTRARCPRVFSDYDSGKTQAGNHMGLRPRDVKRLFISNFRFNCQHSMSFWFKWSREMSHKAYNLQLLIIYFQFFVLSGNVCRKDNFPLPFQLALLRNKIFEQCIFQNHSRLKKLKNFAKPLSLSNITPHLLSRMFKVDCCPISMRQIITSIHFSKRLKSLLYFPASLTVLPSIQDVERRGQLTLLVSK